MKNRITALIIGGILMTLTQSCKKEQLSPNSAITCNIEYPSHPKNSQYQNILDDYTKKGFVGLTVLVDHPTDGLWIGSSGYADIENKVKMTPCHLHHTASIYKTYIAIIVMQLVEEGKLNLDDKLTNYISTDILNELPNGNKVTIKNLLQHRSGMPDVFETDFLMDFFNTPLKFYTIEELLKYAYKKDALSEPGTDYYYSDANFALLSLVISKIDGDYGQSLKTRIFQPLSLTETVFLNSANDVPAGLSRSYWDRYSNGKIENVSDIQIALTSGLKGTDGIVASGNDMKKVLKALANGSLVSNTSLAQMTTFMDVPQSVTEQQAISGYGLGLMRINTSQGMWYGHFGNHVGSGAIALYNPEKDITLVVFQNTGTFFSDKMKPLFFHHLIRDIEKIAL